MNAEPLNIVPLLEAISLIIGHTPLEQKEFIRKFRHVLVHTLRREFPDASVAELSEKTGMLRGTISDYLDQEELPKVAPSNEAHILTLLWEAKDENNMVDIKGENSFYSIAQKQLIGKHSPDTSLKTLLDSSSVEIVDGRLHIKSRKLIINKNIHEMIRILSVAILRLVQTIIKNSSSKYIDKRFQNTIVTKGVHPNNINKLHREIYNYLETTTMDYLQKKIDSYEDDNIYNHPEYAVSIFENF